MHRYTLFGFSHQLDWRPMYFVEAIPAHRICEVCGLLTQWTVLLPCRHVVCKACYGQCFVNEDHECPVDSVQFREDDVQWMEFPVENLLKRKVQCWNQENGCDTIMNASDIFKHFIEDCDHHSTRCPNCSELVLYRSACAHRRSNCSTHASSNQARQLNPSQSSVQEAMSTALQTILHEHVGEMKSGFDQVVRHHNTFSDRLNDVSQIINALREKVTEISQKQTEAGIVVTQIKEDLAEQGGRLVEVANRIGALGEDAKVVADATKLCLENVERSISEIRRRIAADDNRLESVSHTVSPFEVDLNKALERATEIMLQKFKTDVYFSAAAKDAERGQKASHEKENQLLAQRTLGITRHAFCVKGIKALKEKALSTGFAISPCEPIYLCGYHISTLLYLNKNDRSVLVHPCIRLHKGLIDEFLEWPFSHDVKLTFMHPFSEKHRELLDNNSFELEYFGRPTDLSNRGFYSCTSLPLEDLEREGYVVADQLCVNYELQPRTVSQNIVIFQTYHSVL
ncbi:TNF receptor-associated factor 6-like [Rhipicephalus sanguineus]|uniref:TNF receptor-associated factor 6-like n=1 Tax=Rhipicephalus sanguineus TaxID=34632 RepID=UPI0020C4C5C5|nr:TNF receptor-associated factor 6-like [Rhipicephalus sanguineus]